MINKNRINNPPYAKHIPVTKDDGRDHHGKVILDDGKHGSEWAILNTTPSFELELIERFSFQGV